MTTIEKSIRENQLQSTKAINSIKVRAIKQGGYNTNREAIIEACNLHKELYNVDLTPKQLKQ